MPSLFGVFDDSDSQWVAKCYFDRMNELGAFVKAVDYISRGCGYGFDGAYCAFPDADSFYEEDRFDGVRFMYGYGSDAETLFLSEVECFALMESACKSYVESGGERGGEIVKILSESILR